LTPTVSAVGPHPGTLVARNDDDPDLT
jgi:hypothetical protein